MMRECTHPNVGAVLCFHWVVKIQPIWSEQHIKKNERPFGTIVIQ